MVGEGCCSAGSSGVRRLGAVAGVGREKWLEQVGGHY